VRRLSVFTRARFKRSTVQSSFVVAPRHRNPTVVARDRESTTSGVIALALARRLRRRRRDIVVARRRPCDDRGVGRADPYEQLRRRRVGQMVAFLTPEYEVDASWFRFDTAL
jgi:hypothetical protein